MIRKILIFITLLSYQSVWSSENSLQSEIQSILDKSTKKSSFSLRDSEGKELLSVRGDLDLAPASVAKSISTACSLNTLTPAFKFSTHFGFLGKIIEDKLEGDLVIKGEGDPSLVIEDLKEVVDKLRNLYGIKKIEGKIIFDVSYFGKDSIEMAEGFEGDNGRSFATTLTPVPMNQNSFAIWVGSSKRSDSKSVAVAFPVDATDVAIKNTVKLSDETEISVHYDPDKKLVQVSGRFDKDAQPKDIYRAVPDNYEYYSAIMHSLWKQYGGEWKNKEFKISTAPVKYTHLFTSTSRPLAKVMMDVNKLSLNLGAELILLAAAAQKKSQPTNYEKAMSVLDQCLKDMAVPANSIKLTNASGLSREARVKSSGMTHVLSAMLHSAFTPEYLSSFGISGIDGTAKMRLKNYPGRARLKTGTIAGVSSVVGYLYSKNSKPYSFSIILNNFTGEDPKAVQDRILEKLLKSELLQ